MSDLTVAELSEEWRCSQRRILDLIRGHKLPATKPGKRWLVTLEDAQAFKAATSNVPALTRRRRRRAS